MKNNIPFYGFPSICIMLKEEGCTDSRATNYKSSAESDDGSWAFSIAGGEDNTIYFAGTMSVFNEYRF